MRDDDSAIGGFFEDLPVMLIVLAGVATLVISGVVASERISRQQDQSELDALADRLVDSVLVSMSRGPGIEHIPMSATSVNTSRCAGDVLDGESWKVAYVMRYPHMEWLRVDHSDEKMPLMDTGFASRLVNVVVDDGTVGVIEVSAIVWR
jgi:hypothetical protein